MIPFMIPSLTVTILPELEGRILNTVNCCGIIVGVITCRILRERYCEKSLVSPPAIPTEETRKQGRGELVKKRGYGKWTLRPVSLYAAIHPQSTLSSFLPKATCSQAEVSATRQSDSSADRLILSKPTTATSEYGVHGQGSLSRH